MTWALRLQRFTPLTSIAVETVRFDMQAMVNPEISDVEYQQGTLAGYEIKEYLLQKWGRQCAYCKTKSIPLQDEHIIPRSRGGTKRVSNLTVACEDCNQSKNNLTAAEFGHPNIQTQALRLSKTLLQSMPLAMHRSCTQDFGLPISFWTGAGLSSIALSSAIRKPTGLMRPVSVSPGIKSSLICGCRCRRLRLQGMVSAYVSHGQVRIPTDFG